MLPASPSHTPPVTRCGSWRPVDGVGPEHTEHMPQDCGLCWAPCHTRVTPERQRCDDCERALRTHPSPRVRHALTREPVLSRSTLLVLASDSDSLVATGAQFRLIVDDQEHAHA